MKTLKKTLCLVLAVVMVLGLCVMSASADLEYTDNDKITYKEAVDVMSGIGVLAGDERGFRPTDSITRAEAAKIIAYLLVGNSTQADALKANADPFTDVPATHWAAGYIAYCVNAGVINGMGDGTFAPGENVTGLQFAKMLLCALGYNANDEYVNSDWTISVSKDALRLGMFDGNLAGATNTPATREECALYAFNTVAGANEYKGIAKVSYSALLGGYITGLGTGTDASDANKEKTFAKDFDLGKNVEDEDDFGRMAGHSWYVKNAGNVISDLYADDNNLKATYNGKVTGADIASLLGKNFIAEVEKNGRYEVWVNGEDTAGKTAEISIGDLKSSNKDALTYDSFVTGDKIGNGTETLVYAGIDEDDVSWLRIVVIDTYLAKVNTVSKATSTKEAEVTVSLLKGFDGDALIARDGYTTGNGNKFKTDEFAKNDYVLVRIARDDGKIKEMEAAPTVESTISRYNRTDDKVTLTASGTNYVAAKNTATDEADIKAANNTDDVNKNVVNAKKHTLYVDKYGYLIGVAEVEVDSDYVYAAHFDWTTSHTGDFDNRAVGVKLYYADGTNKVVTLNTTAKDGATFAGLDAEDIIDDNPVGIYKLTMKNSKAVLDNTDCDSPAADIAVADKQVKKGISRLLGSAADPDLKADSKTVFFYVNDKAWDDDEFSVTAYIGINAVRTSKDNNATIATYIHDGDKGAEAVLVDDGKAAETSDTVYIYYGDVQVDEENFVATYKTYVKGQQEDLVVEYKNYDDMKAGVEDFEGVINEFFTLTAKNVPTDSKLTGADGKADKPKKIDKVFYDDNRVIDVIDDYYFTVDAVTDAQTDFAWSYEDTLVIDLTGEKDAIESGSALLDAADTKDITIAVQYQDNSSNKVEVIYVTEVTNK